VAQGKCSAAIRQGFGSFETFHEHAGSGVQFAAMKRSHVQFVLVILLTSLCRGSVYFLILGGGPNVYSNQVFFEKNVAFFRATLEQVGLANEPQTLLFGSGMDHGATRDISYVDPKEAPPRVNSLLNQILDGKSEVDVNYRPHDVPRVNGPATKKEITDWFTNTGATLKKGDKLFLYITGHGGGSSNPTEPFRSNISLWNNDSLSVRELRRLLDKVQIDVPVMMVMVQCYSGGFADLVFNEGFSKNQVCPQSRAGFFATMSNLTASGCTTSASEESYADYSTYFFAALGARDRMGHAIEKSRIDLDGDGKISLAEAHAYAQINAESVDIPTCTSDSFLRRIVAIDTAGAFKDQTYTRLRGKSMRATQSAVLDALAEQLKLADRKPDLLDSVRDLDSADATEMRRQSDQRRRVARNYDRARNDLRGMLENRWPELAAPWHPRVASIVREQSDEIIKAVESHPAYQRMTKTGAQLDLIDEKTDHLEIEHAKCQRFIRVLENIALEQRLPEDRKEAFARIIQAESAALP
jgi:hypothetical protein